MVQQYKLAERACLMRISIGLPGKARKDKALTEDVKSEHKLGQAAGSWIKQKYPQWALEPIEKLCNEARAYHAAVTLPFDQGIGILPAALIMEYGDKIREFKGRFDHLRDSHFKAKYSEMIEWAKAAHNGTFDPSDYPPVEEVLESFYFRTEPLPVPDAAHFEGAVKSLLGVDTDSVNLLVQDAMTEAQRALMRRLIAPVRAMVQKLNETPKGNKEDIVFRDTLVGNIQDIARLAPKLNISGDPAIDSFVQDIEKLSRYSPDTLRQDKATRAECASKAAETLRKLEGYKF